MRCYCRTVTHVHTFTCYLRAIADAYIAGKDNKSAGC